MKIYLVYEIDEDDPKQRRIYFSGCFKWEASAKMFAEAAKRRMPDDLHKVQVRIEMFPVISTSPKFFRESDCYRVNFKKGDTEKTAEVTMVAPITDRYTWGEVDDDPGGESFSWTGWAGSPPEAAELALRYKRMYKNGAPQGVELP